jgi:flagellar motor switch protein FliG
MRSAADAAAKPRLSAAEKAAVIVGVLGREAARPLLAGLDAEALRLFGQTMAGLGEISQDMIDAVVAEFAGEVAARGNALRGGSGEALALLEGLVSAEDLSRLQFELAGDDLGPWTRLAAVGAEALAGALGEEHPQVAAIVLSKLPSEISAGVVTALPPDLAQRVVAAIALTRTPDPGDVEAIGRALAMRFSGEAVPSAFADEPAERVTEMLTLAPGFARDLVLGHLEATNPAFAAEVQKKMFTFKDIATRVDKKDVSRLTRAVDQGLLLKALAGAEGVAEASREFILSNISSRLAEQFRETMAEMGVVKVQDADEAQTEVVKAIRNLVSAGEMTLIDLAPSETSET